MATTEIGRPRARVELAGRESRDAQLEVVFQPRATRVSRTLLTLGLTLALVPVALLFPYPWLWATLVLALGLILAHRAWRGDRYVTSFEATCPACDGPLRLKPGATVRDRLTLRCEACASQPVLVLEPASRSAGPEGLERRSPRVDRRTGRDRRGPARRGDAGPPPEP